MRTGALREEQVVDGWHELCLFLGGSGDSFTGKLLELIAKADSVNLARLRTAYPREVAAWLEWLEHAPLTAAELVARLDRLGLEQLGRLR